MKVSEQLKRRLLKDLALKIVAIERIVRGPSGKAAGAWAWRAQAEDGLEIGSEDTMLECVKAKSLGIGQPPWEYGRTKHVHANRG